MEQKLVKKIEFSALAGVSTAAVTKACKPTKALAPACVGKRIDANHEAALAYIKKQKPVVTISIDGGEPQQIDPDDPRIPDQAKVPKASGHTAGRETKKEGKYDPDSFVVPEYIGALADRTLRDLIRHFGTDVRFLDWLKATKELEIINEKRIKNAQSEGSLVSRKLVKTGIIDPFNSAHIKLLTDGSKTIARRVTAMHDAGRDALEIEKFVADQITSFIRPVKAKVARALKNV